jgi:hypothetical protein
LVATVKRTTPLLEPLPPLVIVIHGTALVVVHAQPVGVVTLTRPVLTPEPTLKFVGVTA